MGPLPGPRAQLPAPQTPGQAAHLSPWAPAGRHLSVPLTGLSSLWPPKDVQGAWGQTEGVTALPAQSRVNRKVGAAAGLLEEALESNSGSRGRGSA